MTTRVDFYLLNQPSDTAREIFACRLANKAYSNNHKVFIYLSSAGHAESIDKLLWTYADNAFVPHQIHHAKTNAQPNTDCPIYLGWQNPSEYHNDILLNLSADIPEFYHDFQRVIEIATIDDAARTQAREHYRVYRDAQCALTTHEIKN